MNGLIIFVRNSGWFGGDGHFCDYKKWKGTAGIFRKLSETFNMVTAIRCLARYNGDSAANLAFSTMINNLRGHCKAMAQT